MSIQAIVRELFEVLKEIILSIFVHKAMDREERAAAPSATKKTPEGKKEDRSKAPVEEAPAEKKPVSFIGTYLKDKLQGLSNDHRNFAIIDFVMSEESELDALLALEKNVLEEEKLNAENRFAQTTSNLLADARARFSEEKYEKFRTRLALLMQKNPEGFKLLCEFSDNNWLGQETSEIAKKLDAVYGKPTWVRRERSGEGTILTDYLAGLLGWIRSWLPWGKKVSPYRAMTETALRSGRIEIESVGAGDEFRDVVAPAVPEAPGPATEPPGIFAFAGRVVSDVWCTVNWYVRRIIVLIIGLLVTSVSLFLFFGASTILAGLVFVTVIALLHLLFIRFKYPVVYGIALTVEEVRAGVGHIASAFVATCLITVGLAVIGIVVEGSEFTLFEARLLIVNAVLIGAITLFSGRLRGPFQFCTVALAAFGIVLAISPALRSGLPMQYTKMDQRIAAALDTTAKPPIVAVPARYESSPAPTLPLTLRPGYVPTPRPSGEPEREEFVLVGKDTATSKITVSQSMNTMLTITFCGGSGIIIGKRNVSGTPEWYSTTVPANVPTAWVANDAPSVISRATVPDHYSRFTRAAGAADTVRVTVELQRLLP
jgi:hypothetical protein